MKRKALYYVVFTVAAAGAAAGSWIVSLKSPSSAPAATVPASQAMDVSAISADMKTMLASYRKIIVLTQDEASLSSDERAQANRVGQQLFHENQERINKVDAALAQILTSNPAKASTTPTAWPSAS